jgi:hypothetical protein
MAVVAGRWGTNGGKLAPATRWMTTHSIRHIAQDGQYYSLFWLQGISRMKT